MTSAPARDPPAEHLQNTALPLIDYEPAQLAGVHSMDCDLLVKNGASILKIIKTSQVPVVHATINVATGRGKPTLPELAPALDVTYDRFTSDYLPGSDWQRKEDL
jgi:hypothetical protein